MKLYETTTSISLCRLIMNYIVNIVNSQKVGKEILGDSQTY